MKSLDTIVRILDLCHFGNSNVELVELKLTNFRSIQ